MSSDEDSEQISDAEQQISEDDEEDQEDNEEVEAEVVMDEEDDEEDDGDEDGGDEEDKDTALPVVKEDEDDGEKKKGKKQKDNKKSKGGASKKQGEKVEGKQSTPASKKKYVDYIHEAIVGLKSRNGSSAPAISKFILGNYPDIDAKKLKARLSLTLKSGVKAGRFAKVKASFKISSEWKKKISRKAAAAKRRKKAMLQKKKAAAAKKAKETAAAKAAAAKAAAAKAAEEEKKKIVEIPSDPIERKIYYLMQKDPVDQKQIDKLREDQRKKKEQEIWKQKVAERIRKRRFPMEDIKLREEDKELGVKPPSDVTSRPSLPYFFSLNCNSDKKKNRTISAASRCEDLDSSSRGLVPDLLQIYHFFCGDVHYNTINKKYQNKESLVPPFSLQNLIHAVQEIINGNAKKSRMVPPLIVHLFCVCLQLLLTTNDEESATIDGMEDPYHLKSRKQLQRDFQTHLAPALSPASWADVCFMYMDAMERYYTTEGSMDHNVLNGHPIDSSFLFYLKDDDTPPEASPSLPSGYCGYLGDPSGSVSRAHSRLAKQDPWTLTAEEIIALLRALTDDVLANQPEIGLDIASRQEEMVELLRAKRAADTKFRKVRLAFEGPKNKYQSSNKKKENGSNNGEKDSKKSKESNDGTEEENNGDQTKTAERGNNSDGKAQKESPNKKSTETFKPTATKKQFEMAKKAQQRANDAYEKGVRKLLARTEPVGFDHNFNALYCFRQDPEILYIEANKTPPAYHDDGGKPPRIPCEMHFRKSSWHIVETRSLFDSFISSLDIRGKREYALHEALLGPQGCQQSLRRFLFDDIKEKNDAMAMLREKEDLRRRMENAKLKCDEEEGRRSGRLAGRATEELEQIEYEILDLERKIKNSNESKPLDYYELTGLDLLCKFDDNVSGGGKPQTRRSRGKKENKQNEAKKKNFAIIPSSKLYSTGNIDGTGIIGLLVSQMFEVEELCECLAPWEREEGSRKSWISDLEDLVHAWNVSSPIHIGPSETQQKQDIFSSPASPSSNAASSSSSKRRKLDNANATTPSSVLSSSATPQVSQILAKLKQSLLELEQRVFVITGLAVSTRDADVADDNMSTDDADELDDEMERVNRQKIAWKKIIHKLRSIPTKRYIQIRELLVEAIAAARKAQLKDIVAQLRAALLEYHPNAAFSCKSIAIEILEKHGGYEADDDDEDDDNDAINDDAANAGPSDQREQELPSALSAEAVIMNSSLEGMEDASRMDWKSAVRSGRTVSRIAALVTTFVWRASEKLKKLQIERERLIDAINFWEKEKVKTNRSSKSKKKNSKAGSSDNFEEPTEVWANATYTDELCMVKVEDYPWWPAKKCFANDKELENSLDELDRSLVSLIGERGSLRVVKTSSSVRDFTGKPVIDEDDEDEDEDEDANSNTSKKFISDKELRTQLDDCMAMARRILRATEKTSKNKKSAPANKADIAEEKKMAT